MNQHSRTFWQNQETATQSFVGSELSEEIRVPGLTILAHSDLQRVGEQAALVALASDQEVELSRLMPLFATPGTSRRRPLAELHLSRRPVRLMSIGKEFLKLALDGSKTRVVIDGERVEETVMIPRSALGRGVVIVLSEHVTLLLHWLIPIPPQELPHFGLVGDSSPMIVLRQQIHRVADLHVSALLRGETGTGKELVARAIHEASNRRERPFVAVNMGAIPPSLAAAELFGAEKGAFTGANRARRGFFRSADGGTLFLDEIGETPSEVQGMLLRVLETGEIQPVGSENPRKVNVRVLAATDARLEMEIAEGRFRAPLLHRLNGFEIRLPPLRERLDDLGRLLLHFLRQEMENLGENFSLVASGNPRGPWLPAPLVAQLAMGHWPGNVRQLLNITRQLVIGNRGAQQLRLTPEIAAQLEQFPAQGDSESSRTSPDDLQADVIAPSATSQEVVKPLVLRDSMDRSSLKESLGDRRALLVMSEQDQKVRRLMAEYGGHEIDKTDGLLLLFDRPADALGFALSYQEPAGGQPPGPEPSAPSPVESKPSYRRPGEVSEQELLAALKAYGFRLQPTAAALNISRTSLYALIKKSPHVRKARDLTQEEITQALERCRGDLEATAAELEVSRKGLRRRMTELGFK